MTSQTATAHWVVVRPGAGGVSASADWLARAGGAEPTAGRERSDGSMGPRPQLP